VIARCQLHKRRSLQDHLPEKLRHRSGTSHRCLTRELRVDDPNLLSPLQNRQTLAGRTDGAPLSEVKRMSEVEIATVADWSTPPGWRTRTVSGEDGRTRPAPPPAPANVPIKLGGRAGIQTQVSMTQIELNLHETNERWLGEAAP
jgi:hypothetical protein